MLGVFNNVTIHYLSEAHYLINFRRNIAKRREKWGRNKTPHMSGLGQKEVSISGQNIHHGSIYESWKMHLIHALHP